MGQAQNVPALEERALHELPEKQQEMARLIAYGVDKFDAFEQAGFSTEGRGWRANARKLATRLAPVIADQVKLRIDSTVPASLDAIRELVEQTEDNRTRLAAAKWVMATAGYDQPVKHEHTHKHVEELSEDAIREELRNILGERAIINGESE